MYLGRPVEHGPAAAIFERPRHPYTRALLASTPRIDAAKRLDRAPPSGELPSPLSPPAGCAFHTRCPLAEARCTLERPLPRRLDGREVACHRAESLRSNPA
jgi:dipeptide transport system ATP-binding protein